MTAVMLICYSNARPVYALTLTCPCPCFWTCLLWVFLASSQLSASCFCLVWWPAESLLHSRSHNSTVPQFVPWHQPFLSNADCTLSLTAVSPLGTSFMWNTCSWELVLITNGHRLDKFIFKASFGRHLHPSCCFYWTCCLSETYLEQAKFIPSFLISGQGISSSVFELI